MEITLDTKIHDLLKAYPFLEDELIKINPKFKKLKNPILRRTVARVAAVKQAAIVGGMDPVVLLNRIREAVGQEPLDIKVEEAQIEKVPQWITKEADEVIDVASLLDSGKNPLAETMKSLQSLPSGAVVVLKSDFKPEPLIDQMRKNGYEVFCQEAGEEYLTFIKKP